jgi:hypothetical protein
MSPSLQSFTTLVSFSENMIDFGVMANVDSGPPESNHESNAKAPSQRTQMQMESFEIQTPKPPYCTSGPGNPNLLALLHIQSSWQIGMWGLLKTIIQVKVRVFFVAL